MAKRYKSIFISDIHLGVPSLNQDIFLNEFKKMEAENLFLIGDVFSVNAEETHQDVEQFREILASKEWNITYLKGNHEEDREHLNKPRLSLHHTEETIGESHAIYANQTRIYLEHGHSFHEKDIVNRSLKNIVLLYKKMNKLRKRVTKDSRIREKKNFYLKYIKPLAQKILSSSFEQYMVARAKEQDCDTVICGHLHLPKDIKIEGIRYLNCGDWIKNHTYVVEDSRGNLSLKQTH